MRENELRFSSPTGDSLTGDDRGAENDAVRHSILFLGANSGTSRHRADALRRLKHHVRVVDPGTFVPEGAIARRLHWETGGLLAEKTVTEGVLAKISGETYDFVWVDNGRYVGPDLINQFRRMAPVINLNVDDPFGTRDRFSWALYRRAVSAYDLVVVVREENVAEARTLGARAVMRVYRAADEVAHAPRPEFDPETSGAEWPYEVLFVGTWMPERGRFMAELVRRGVPLAIFGNKWEQAPEWRSGVLKAALRGPGVDSDEAYARLIQGSKICLGLVSKGNRDLHTTRSLEIPCLRGLFCAERTSEHQLLYVEGEEAVFWKDAAECADVCRTLLADDDRRSRIAAQGERRCHLNGTLNEKVARRVLEGVLRK